MNKYLLVPTWEIENPSRLRRDIPVNFVKSFETKKDIEKYLDSNEIENELFKIMQDRIYENEAKTKEEMKEQFMRAMSFRRITFWVICVNPIGKENRLGIMEKGEKGWKYCTMMGGKVWKHTLLFGTY